MTLTTGEAAIQGEELKSLATPYIALMGSLIGPYGAAADKSG